VPKLASESHHELDPENFREGGKNAKDRLYLIAGDACRALHHPAPLEAGGASDANLNRARYKAWDEFQHSHPRAS
jgi:hypothetical protein